MIIFEGEELLLHHYEGKSNYIIITFSSADQTEMAHSRYFLQSVVEKYKLSCLGITAKIDNFYQHSDMYNIILLCNEISKKYIKIVLVGLSMGAYGALKYSAELHADIVFAMGPRYTLDINICPVCDIMQRIVDRLDPYSIQDTTIKPDEVAGKLYIAHDTYHNDTGYNGIDHKHVEKIVNNLPNVVLVPVMFAHHLVINSLKGSEEFKSILDALIKQDDSGVIQQVVNIRRHHINNIISKVLLFQSRYPLLIYKLLVSKSFSLVKKNHLLFDNNKNNLVLIYNLQLKKYATESAILLKLCFLRTALNYSFYEGLQLNRQSLFNKNIQSLPYFIAHSGHFLVFDKMSKKIISVCEFVFSAQYLPLRLYRNQGQDRLVCVVNDCLLELCYGYKELYLRLLLIHDFTDHVIILEKQESTVVIYTPDHQHCLSIDQKGQCNFYDITPEKWENFVVV